MIARDKLAAPCGLYCGACSVYVAYKSNDMKLKEKVAPIFGVTVDQISCEGCFSEKLFKYCQTCSIRDCALEQDLEGCYQCRDFPCHFIHVFPTEAGRKIMLRSVSRWRELGTRRWMEEEEKRYHCLNCGHRVLRGAKRCANCRNPVDTD